MNRFLSIIELKAKQYLWKVAAVLAVMAAGELVWFALMLRNVPDWTLYKAGRVYTLVFAAMLTAVTVLLGGIRADRSNSEIRLRMLKTSPCGIYLTEVLFSLICLLLAWAVQAAVVMLSARMFMGAEGYTFGPQGAVQQICSHWGLLTIVPVGVIRKWIMTSMCLLVLSLAAAYMKHSSRSHSFSISSWFEIIIVDIFFLFRANNDSVAEDLNLGPFIAAFFAAVSLWLALSELKRGREERDDGE